MLDDVAIEGARWLRIFTRRRVFVHDVTAAHVNHNASWPYRMCISIIQGGAPHQPCIHKVLPRQWTKLSGIEIQIKIMHVVPNVDHMALALEAVPGDLRKATSHSQYTTPG
eukprot:CAMPEP_0180560160 /NCGR_PEP_ID=MMETSP1037_2-20121125/2691_1 /TAXON_ID=632150 /ORGANISM="Azadinium spinosum, Strain 3D9" /LENGTH=110 /DNA_ID=CAMNT_0022576699 /DNA_START=618 /DNA_END=950 /DNA_ORIENTATION=-